MVDMSLEGHLSMGNGVDWAEGEAEDPAGGLLSDPWRTGKNRTASG